MGEFLRSVLLRLANQPSEHLILLRVMGQQYVFVDRVESYQGLSRDSFLNEILPAVVTEDPFDEVLSERRITEASFFLDRSQRKLLLKSSRKQSDPVPTVPPLFIVDPNPLDPAAW